MSDEGGGARATPQYIEVPVKRESTRTQVNLGNLLLLGGIGYMAFRTFLLEERLNDLTVLVRRQGAMKTTQHPAAVQTLHERTEEEEEEEDDAYETSEGDFDESDRAEDENPEDEAPRLEEIPRVETVSPPPPPPTSAFVTTRQRRVGSESRRGDRVGRAAS